MKSKAAAVFKIFFLLTVLAMPVGCALFSSDEEPGRKDDKLKYEDPPMPYRKIDVSNADSVWQSENTGNTIAINSSCKRSDATLKTLEDNILSGVDDLSSRTSHKFQLDGSEADRIHAEGKADGVPVDIELVVVKKN